MGINTKRIQSFAVTTAFWLNVSVAAGIILYEIQSQRAAKNA